MGLQRNEKEGEGSSEEEDSGAGGDPLVPGDSPDPGGIPFFFFTSSTSDRFYSIRRKKEGVIP